MYEVSYLYVGIRSATSVCVLFLSPRSQSLNNSFRVAVMPIYYLDSFFSFFFVFFWNKCDLKAKHIYRFFNPYKANACLLEFANKNHANIQLTEFLTRLSWSFFQLLVL